MGFASTVLVEGRHIHQPSVQMHNRGNGKGGGIAAASLDPGQMGVEAETLRQDTILQLALVDKDAEDEVEKECIAAVYRIDHKVKIRPVARHEDLGLEVEPPDIVRYFVRVKDGVLDAFVHEHGLEDAPRRAVEDEIVFRTTGNLNRRFYAALGKRRAFVLSHARDLLIFKIVGYAEQVVTCYGLEDLRARIWIAHQRYPTRGRVWHPAGCHPFIGVNEALVHNGDFANYHGVAQHLRQHGIEPLFLTDTEVAALLFDLLARTNGYPLEYVIEALAPTTELDLDRLAPERRQDYRAIQSIHLRGSPDGPWFFIVARSETDEGRFRLLGITDTSMLRPQVFAIQQGDATIGLVASEKQAIDATLQSLSAADGRFRKVADRYWNARGGSFTDGGAFCFTVEGEGEHRALACEDKFGHVITAPEGEYRLAPEGRNEPPEQAQNLIAGIDELGSAPNDEPAQAPAGPETTLRVRGPEMMLQRILSALPGWRLAQLEWTVDRIARAGTRAPDPGEAIELLCLLNDRRYDCGGVRRSALLQIVREAIDRILGAVAPIERGGSSAWRRIGWNSREMLRGPRDGERVLVVDCRGFPPEGQACDARLGVKAYAAGWRRFVFHGLQGQRFTGCGFGPDSSGVRIDVHGCSGDYLASGIDGLEIRVHDSAQDQVAQIMKSGKLVVFGDVGQALLYGGKGGEVYVLGNAAGRPVINAVGCPRVVINGTALDYLAESFMAGDPHAGGGFVVLNGMSFDDGGRLVEQETPYPGSNLFSLASGGAIFVRDPRHELTEDQLNGGEFAPLSQADWKLILPYLEENERLFGIPVEALLTVDGTVLMPAEVYRKVWAVKLTVLAK